MNRPLAYLLGPEAVLAAVTGAVLWFCGRHSSGLGRDVELMEKLIWLLPLLVVPVAFATGFVPGARSWWWLARTLGCVFLALCLCGGRAIDGLGSGSKGQDAAMIIIFVFGLILVSLGIAVSGAMILCETRPGFAAWFQARRVIASILTLLAAVPVGFALGLVIIVAFSVGMGVFSAFRR